MAFSMSNKKLQEQQDAGGYHLNSIIIPYTNTDTGDSTDTHISSGTNTNTFTNANRGTRLDITSTLSGLNKSRQ